MLHKTPKQVPSVPFEGMVVHCNTFQKVGVSSVKDCLQTTVAFFNSLLCIYEPGPELFEAFLQ